MYAYINKKNYNMCYMLWNGVVFLFLFIYLFILFILFYFILFVSLCELNIWSGSGCFIVEAFKVEVFLYSAIYVGYVAGQEHFMYV